MNGHEEELMRDRTRPLPGIIARLCATALLAALGAVGTCAADTAPATTAPAPGDPASPHIEAVLSDPEVVRAIRAWGLSLADVRHDVAALPPEDRLRLAYVLTRRWPSDDTYTQADLQAQFLVTMSLMRESTLFASILSSGGSLLR
jgi:hypothetical protein